MNVLLLFLLSSFFYYSAFSSGLSESPHPRPLVLWHGLDSHSSPGMLQFIKLIQDIHPNIFIHSVYIEEDLDRDRRAGFYGDVNLQVAQVAEQLSAITQLQNGFDAIGLSQGGQFLRAYVERFNSPPVHNLITFGSQHMGISDIPLCRPRDFICQAARRVAKSAVYSAWAQNNLVQAQYFRDPWNLPAYLIANHFLTSINNEISEMRNRSYSQQLATLNNLVLVLFTEDKTVVPKESAWFGSEIADDGLNWSDQSVLASTTNKTILPLRRQPLYIEDWIGLRKLDERGGIVFESCQVSTCR
ncbi:palmitoyl-protein thioesterase [Cyathus striatus]|nr:palmitoyl-protein thioesterase [Cyathus striatus]